MDTPNVSAFTPGSLGVTTLSEAQAPALEPQAPPLTIDDSGIVAQKVTADEKYKVPFLRVPTKKGTDEIDGVSRTVWDLSPYVPEEHAIGVPGLRAVYANEMFRKGTIAIQFGLPNMALFETTDEELVFQPAPQSPERGPVQVLNAHGKVESGWYVVPHGVPDEAFKNLRREASQFKGYKDTSSVEATTSILGKAGFTIGGQDPTSIATEDLLKVVYTKGLEFEKEPLKFSIAKTTPLDVAVFIDKLPAAVAKDTHKSLSSNYTSAGKAPDSTLAVSVDDHVYGFSIAKTSGLGRFARKVWGAHPVYKIDFTELGLDMDDYLPNKLEAFATADRSRSMKIKKTVIFSDTVVKFVHKHMEREYVEQEHLVDLDLTELLVAGTPDVPNIYNIVVTSKELIAGKLRVWMPKVDWIFSKHVLLANYSPDVRFAGEIWKDNDDCIHFSNNSGTYTPSSEELESWHRLSEKLFPNATIKTEDISK